MEAKLMKGYIKIQIRDYFKYHIAEYFFVILIFIVGIVIGALAVKTLPDDQKTELIDILKLFFSGLAKNETVENFPHLLGSVIMNNIKIVGLIWFLGFTIIGIPFVVRL